MRHETAYGKSINKKNVIICSIYNAQAGTRTTILVPGPRRVIDMWDLDAGGHQGALKYDYK